MCKFINIISVILDKINYLQKLKAIKSSRTIIYFKLSYIQHQHFFLYYLKGIYFFLLFFFYFIIYIKKKNFFYLFLLLFLFYFILFLFYFLGFLEMDNTSSKSATIPVLRRGLRRYDIQNKDFILIFIHDLQSWSISKL